MLIIAKNSGSGHLFQRTKISDRVFTEEILCKLQQLAENPLICQLREEFLEREIEYDTRTALQLYVLFANYVNSNSEQEKSYIKNVQQFLVKKDMDLCLSEEEILLFFAVYSFALQQHQLLKNIWNCESGFYQQKKREEDEWNNCYMTYTYGSTTFTALIRDIPTSHFRILKTMQCGEKKGAFTLLDKTNKKEKILSYDIILICIPDRRLQEVQGFVYNFVEDANSLIINCKTEYGNKITVQKKKINNNTTKPDERSWLNVVKQGNGNINCIQNGNDVLVFIVGLIVEKDDKYIPAINKDIVADNAIHVAKQLEV